MSQGTQSRGCLLLLLAVCLLLPSLVMAQSASTGALAGTVTDPTGAVIPNVAVTVTSVATGEVRIAMTKGDGSYIVGLLSPGDYRVKFGAAGFRTTEVPVVTITVTETGTLNQSLIVGAQTQEVTVQASVETVQTTNATVGSTVAGNTVTDLPLSNRNYSNLLSLTTGASANVTNATTLGKNSQATAVNGSGTGSNNYQMDGASIVVYGAVGCCSESGTENGFGVPNPDAIQEFKIATSQYDAGYGQNPGANVNVVTKGGTNDFHGTAFEYFRNTVLNANDWFSNFHDVPRGALDQNQFGGVFGGPVKKDKLFFFTSFQETAQKNGLSPAGRDSFNLPWLPADSAGDPRTNIAPGGWVDQLYQHYCGVGGQVPAQTGTVQIKAGSVPCANAHNNALAVASISPATLSLLQLKLPNGNYYIPSPLDAATPGVACNPVSFTAAPYGVSSCVGTAAAIYHEYQGVGNWDYVINSKNTLSGRYFVTTDPSTQSFLNTTGLPGGSGVAAQFTNHEAVLKLTTIVTSNLVNEARLSFQRNIAQDKELTPFTNSEVGIVAPTPGIDYLQQTAVTGAFQLGSYQFGDANDLTNNYQYADQLSWTHGKQTIRTGFEAQHTDWNWIFPGLGIGSVTLASFPDMLLGLAGNCGPVTATCDGGFSSNVSTGPTSTRFESAALAGDYHRYATFLDTFFQDDIKVNARLTLNLGVRWEYDGLPAERNGFNSNLIGSLATLASPGSLLVGTATRGVLGCPVPTANFPAPPPACGTYVGYALPSNYNLPLPGGVVRLNHTIASLGKTPLDNFAPRVGLAWRPLNTNRFVVRSGFGYFYDRIGGENWIHGPEGGAPYAATVGNSGANYPGATMPVPYIPGATNFLPRWVTLPNPGAGLNAGSSNLNQGGVGPYFQTPLVYEWNLNTQYEFLPSWVAEVGYVGSHGIHQFDGGALYNAAPLVNDPFQGNAPSLANVNLRVPYLGLAPSYGTATTDYAEKYNSLQASLRKNFSHGLLLQAAYTWNRGLVTSNYGFNSAPYVLPVYGLNSLYHPQRFTLTYAWDLPFGHHDGLTGKLVNGWNVSGTTTIQNGTPVALTDSRGATIFGTPVASTPEFAAGKTNASIEAPGSVEQRVINGLETPASGGYFNPASSTFIAPPSAAAPFSSCISNCGTQYGDVGLGTVLGPGQNNWDIAIIKTTTVGGLRESATLQFRAEFFNAFNHAQFSNPSAGSLGVTSPSFGQITTNSVNPRLIQFALRYSF